MCVMAFAIGMSARWPLVLAANRDEFLDRPAAPLACWSSARGTRITSGRDLRDGGAWLGLSERGRIAMLTNVRNAQPGRGARSRGELVVRWLEGGIDADRFVESLHGADYGGFNLVIGEPLRGHWWWLSNQDDAGGHADAGSGLIRQALVPGLYGLSNAALDTPWPKTLRLKGWLADALEHSADSATLTARMLRRLAATERAPDAELPRTGVPLDWERGLSSIRVELPEHGYATRVSTVVVAEPGRAGKTWRLEAEERTYDGPALHARATLDWPT